MTPLTKFQVQLARIDQLGYARCVSFNVGTGPLYPSAGGAARSYEGRTAPPSLTGKSSIVRAKRLQVHRTNRVIQSSPNPFFPTWGES